MKISEWPEYGQALVLGLGASGQAAARLLIEEGVGVVAIDKCENDETIKAGALVRSMGGEIVLGSEDLPSDDFDVCIVSPGISCDSPWVREMEKRGVEVISELELGWSRCQCKVLAITGTNGKSTMVKFCRDALCANGKKSEATGNYGFPLSDFALQSSNYDWAVVEVSSFQLERVKNFRPQIGVLLNVQPDHLDRHGDMDAYRGYKARLFDRMTGNDVGIVLDSEREKTAAISSGRNRWISFGQDELSDYRYVPGKIICRLTDKSVREVLLSGTAFDNNVTGLTLAAASAALWECGLNEKAVQETLSVFEPLHHRMQVVAEKLGVRFIDDSKATNLAAMEAGLQMAGSGVRLIAGGLLKEKNLESVKEVLVKRAESVYLIGSCARLMDEAWRDVVSCRVCGDLSIAVKEAWHDAREGETVLLSPGCASFDQFRDYKDRGNQFKRIIMEEI